MDSINLLQALSPLWRVKSMAGFMEEKCGFRRQAMVTSDGFMVNKPGVKITSKNNMCF